MTCRSPRHAKHLTSPYLILVALNPGDSITTGPAPLMFMGSLPDRLTRALGP